MADPYPIPTRAAGLARLQTFVPRAGLAYATQRNRDVAGHVHVSGLSPWLRHRLVTEDEVIAAVREAHPQGAEKFLAEVWWRTYWKGWLELRPSVWADYRRDLAATLDRLQVEDGMRRRWQDACEGRTGIDGFDHWAQELAATGYLHNHARMWFASIWIFTLGLPWQLGADFFLRHLIDGDPASNTLSWRWVAGLHTPGKTYLATADNIARNTDGRFAPQGLATVAMPVGSVPHPAPRAAPRGDEPDPTIPALHLITEEDLTPEEMPAGSRMAGVAVLSDPVGRSPLAVATGVSGFTAAAIDDALSRLGSPKTGHFGAAELLALVDHAASLGARQIVTAYAPVGPIAELLERLHPLADARGVALVRRLRRHDRDAWPHATHGFFRFREAVM